jgi:hypothetical protein
MARDGVAVNAKLAAAVAAHVAAPGSQNVAAVCRDLDVSRQTFYKYARRFTTLGIEGFYPDSRRPRSSPDRFPSELEDVLIAVRKHEADRGWDYGADAVLMRLEEQVRADPTLWPPGQPLPSRTTINRVFEARGQLQKVPQRKPRRRGGRRFQRDHVNSLWQFDGFDYQLAGGTPAVVLQLTDDCSRTDLALQAAVSENGADIWDTFCVAVERYGLPTQVLTDNGGAFSGRRRGWISDFEASLYALGVEPIQARVSHPQTCGKNERAHQRIRKWLNCRVTAPTRDNLQHLLDTYRNDYNTRRNMVLGKLTPHQRFELGPLATITDLPPVRTALTRHSITTTGSIGLDGTLIGLGRKHAHKPAIAFRTGDYVAIFIDNQLARDLVIDRTRRYQPQDR